MGNTKMAIFFSVLFFWRHVHGKVWEITYTLGWRESKLVNKYFFIYAVLRDELNGSSYKHLYNREISCNRGFWRRKMKKTWLWENWYNLWDFLFILEELAFFRKKSQRHLLEIRLFDFQKWYELRTPLAHSECFPRGEDMSLLLCTLGI